MDIALLRRPLEQRLSAVTGLHARLGRIDVSAFGALLEIGDITLTAPDTPPDQPPVASVARVRVELSLRKAFRGELRIRSMAVEQPILSIRRDERGRLVLPTRPRRRQAAAPRGSSGSEERASPPSRRLSVVIERAVLVGGEAHFRDESAATPAGVYHVAATGIEAELLRRGGGYEFTVLGDRLGRIDAAGAASRDRGLLGRLRLTAHLDRADDLAQLEAAGLRAEIRIGDEPTPLVRGSIASDRILEKVLQFSLQAATDAALLAIFAPRPLPPLLSAARGAVQLRVSGRRDREGSILFEELSLTADRMSFGP